MQLITIIVIPGKKDNKETGTMFRCLLLLHLFLFLSNM